ncbi:MAG TPA: outer membrane beta-barrel protein [Thermoanaerobaculia bacterium]|nr:outer membrane beta-barrel protein [Thermoanaerobaculia bacterium]
MRRLGLALVLVATAFVLPASRATAQGTGGFQFGLSGGASLPTSDTKDAFDDGWHGGLVLNYEFPALPIGIRVDGDYRKFGPKSGTPGVHPSQEIIDGNANLVVGLRIIALKVYALGGAGIYNMGSASGVLSSGSELDFGWNAGAGVAFVLGKVSIFGEGRYHEVTLDNSAGKFKFVAATAGILF